MTRLLVLAVLLGCHGAPQRDPSALYDGFPDPHPSLLITNPRTLLALEISGWSFGDVTGTRDRGSSRRADYAEEAADVLIRRSPVYADLSAAVGHDLEALAASSPDVGVGLDHMDRMFDPAWLSSARSHYELVGVVNRFDLRTEGTSGCGQTRLIYRLAHHPARDDRSPSRLPMTVSMIYFDRRTDCAEVARQWMAIEDAKGSDLATRLRSGPLAHLRPTAFDRIELNVQSLREIGVPGRTGFQEQAQYVLRGFDVVNGHLVASRLRNTPATDLSGAKLAVLRSWIRDHVAAIDAGTAEVPAEFLATTAVSKAPYGLARRSNRPFRQLFPDATAAFGDLDLHGNQVVTSPVLLVRRLDELSCTGCHQTRSVAGFHLLGEDRSGEPREAMVIGISSHLRETLAWRARFLRAAATGHDLAEVMPFPEHADDAGGYGAHCTPPGEAAGGPEWHCATGLECRSNPVAGNDIGLCVVAGGTHAGDPCQDVKLVAASGVDDEVASPEPPRRCAIEVPRPGQGGGTAMIGRCNVKGFAGGMCTAVCNLGVKINGAVCAVGQRPGFERACFRPDVKPEDCLLMPGNFTHLLLQACSRTEPCRDDYVCIRVPDRPLDHGACAPPYLLREIRVDQAPVDL